MEKNNQRSDESLLEAYFEGELQAFEVFFERHFRRVESYALKKGVRPAEAKEVAQEVFLKLHRSIERYEHGKAALPWFFTIVHNTCIDWLRSKGSEKSRLLSLTDEVSLHEEPDSQEEGWTDEVAHAIQSLPPEQRRVVELRTFRELSFRDISAETGKTEVSLRKTYQRALGSLKSLLSRKGG